MILLFSTKFHTVLRMLGGNIKTWTKYQENELASGPGSNFFLQNEYKRVKKETVFITTDTLLLLFANTQPVTTSAASIT